MHDIQTEVKTAVLRHHTDMIDALYKYEFPNKVLKTKSAHVTWLLSASRDRKIALWKLIDGKIMTKSDYPNAKTTQALLDNKRLSAGNNTTNNQHASQ